MTLACSLFTTYVTLARSFNLSVSSETMNEKLWYYSTPTTTLSITITISTRDRLLLPESQPLLPLILEG